MMAAGLSACSQSNAKLEGKSGIVKDEASKTEGDTGVVDQAPATYVDAEYVNKNDIISTDDTATIDGISYKIDSYEHTTEFGNRNKDTVAESLKDSYEGNIDEKTAKHLIERRKRQEREKSINATAKVSLNELFNQIEKGKLKELNIIVKADVQGSVEAVKQSLEKLSNDQVTVKVIHAKFYG